MELEIGGEGEGVFAAGYPGLKYPHFVLEEIIQERKLTMDEASKGLNTLGKDESGVRYAYLMMSVPDMKLTDISVVTNFNHLFFLDLSGNLLNLEALQVVAQLPFLLYLKADRNRVESAALISMPYLQVLLLNKNAIAETGDISQPMLETLELSDNVIYTIQFNPDRLENIKEIVLSGNHLLDTSGTYPTNLERLFLGRNQISKINTDFSQLTKLQYLHLRENNIRKLTGFTSELENLTYLNLRSNKINKVRQFRKLACLPALETLIVLDNPVYVEIPVQKGEGGEATERAEITEGEEEVEIFGEEGPPIDTVRIGILVLLPKLKRINKDVVTPDEREVAEQNRQNLLEDIFAEESSEDEVDYPTTTTDYTTETDVDTGHPVSEQSGREDDEYY